MSNQLNDEIDILASRLRVPKVERFCGGRIFSDIERLIEIATFGAHPVTTEPSDEIVDASEPNDMILSLFGYKAGKYVHRCALCNETTWGIAKRSCCRECARARYAEFRDQFLASQGGIS